MMAKLSVSASAAVLLALAFSNAYSQAAKITIDKIDENKSISGHVTGLDKTMAKGFRVAVYVHTDIWYIHPYAGQGDGQSWSSIADDGSWSVATVKRAFSADQIAALVVEQGYDFPARTPSVEGVKNIGIFIKSLKGTPDFGKL
jgi:hypothetical protein